MAMTTANVSFHLNTNDVHSLLDFHAKETGTGRGRRWQVEVLNKSAIVMLCASWEAYCEDVVGVVVEHFVTHAPSPMDLPSELRRKITGELTAKGQQDRIWTLAGDGWRALLEERLETLKLERDRMLNTPKSEQLRTLFKHNTGHEDITRCWRWHGVSPETACERLDEFVVLRGAIAHRATADEYVRKGEVLRALGLVGKLVTATDEAMIELAVSVTGVPLPDHSPGVALMRYADQEQGTSSEE